MTACTRREIARYGGLVNSMPRYAFVFMMFMLASVGLPGTSGFIGEFLVMVGRVPGQHLGRAFFITTGIILGAAYMLWLYRRVIFGELVKDDVKAMLDSRRARWRSSRRWSCWCCGWASIRPASPRSPARPSTS